MKALIIGDGKVGYAVAELLSLEQHDVTIIDNNAEALTKAVSNLDVLCIKGSGSSITTLKEAGIEQMDLVLAVTSSDELNIVCSVIAHSLSNARILARIRNPEYFEHEEFIKETMGIHFCVNPEAYAANEISRILRYPHALSIESFMRGRVEMVEFLLEADSPIINRPLSRITPELPAHVLISTVLRNGESLIPNGETILKEGDHIFVVAEPSQSILFMKHLGIERHKLRQLMIVGGGRIAFYLARQMQKIGVHVRILELNPKRCDDLFLSLPETLIINADGTDHDVLDHEQLSDMDAFVALTNRDEENIVAGLYAKDNGIPSVAIKLSRGYYSRIAEGLSTINPKLLAATRIVRYVRSLVNSEGSFVDQLYIIAGGTAQAMEFIVDPSSKVVDIPLSRLNLGKGILVAAIMHNGRVSIPSGESVIRGGDSVIIVTNTERIFLDINDILYGG